MSPSQCTYYVIILGGGQNWAKVDYIISPISMLKDKNCIITTVTVTLAGLLTRSVGAGARILAELQRFARLGRLSCSGGGWVGD